MTPGGTAHLPPCADPVVKLTVWHASRQCYRNTTLKVCR